MEKKDKKNIPIKNYIILIALFIGVILILLYFSNWYKVVRDYEDDIPVIRGTLAEISDAEVDHYIMENPSTVLYLCTSNDPNCRSFESKFKKVLQKDENLKNSIIYVNLTDLDRDSFVNEFNNKYSYKKKLSTKYPAIVLFEDGKIIGIVQDKSSKLDVNLVKDFLRLHKVGETIS